MKTLYDYMNEYSLVNTDDSGKEIQRQKDLFFTHTGIIMGMNRYTGLKMVFHNHPSTGPAIVSFNEYADGKVCSYTNRPHDTREIVLMRSFKQVDAQNSYTVMNYNCQDASKYAREGKTGSHGRENALGTLFFGALFALLVTADKE